MSEQLCRICNVYPASIDSLCKKCKGVSGNELGVSSYLLEFAKQVEEMAKTPVSKQTIFLMFCTNDPDNGSHTGRSDSFEFDDLMRLEGGSVVCRHIGNSIKIHRRKYPILSYGSWIGNWCWDGARVTVETANAIANYLQSLDEFSCNEAEEGLYEAWQAKQPIDFGKVITP